jgi:hypothetical protein
MYEHRTVQGLIAQFVSKLQHSDTATPVDTSQNGAVPKTSDKNLWRSAAIQEIARRTSVRQLALIEVDICRAMASWAWFGDLMSHRLLA